MPSRIVFLAILYCIWGVVTFDELTLTMEYCNTVHIMTVIKSNQEQYFVGASVKQDDRPESLHCAHFDTQYEADK